jgi:hypothetical protein
MVAVARAALRRAGIWQPCRSRAAHGAAVREREEQRGTGMFCAHEWGFPRRRGSKDIQVCTKCGAERDSRVKFGDWRPEMQRKEKLGCCNSAGSR